MTPDQFLRQQADCIRVADADRDRLAERLGISRRKLDALLAASAREPGMAWDLR